MPDVRNEMVREQAAAVPVDMGSIAGGATPGVDSGADTDLPATRLIYVALLMFVLLGAIGYGWYRATAEAATRRGAVLLMPINMNFLASDVQHFAKDAGRYPTDAEGLTILTKPWPLGPYVRADSILDPWGRTLGYHLDMGAKRFDIVWLGVDGLPGGSGEDADVVVSGAVATP